MALSQGWTWPWGWNHRKQWKHNWKGEKPKPLTTSGYSHTACPCSFRNCSFHPRPKHKWCITFLLYCGKKKVFPLCPWCFVLFFQTILFYFVLKPTDFSLEKKTRINKTVCQFSNNVSQYLPITVMSSRAAVRVTLCFGNHTGRKSNKQ